MVTQRLVHGHLRWGFIGHEGFASFGSGESGRTSAEEGYRRYLNGDSDYYFERPENVSVPEQMEVITPPDSRLPALQSEVALLQAEIERLKTKNQEMNLGLANIQRWQRDICAATGSWGADSALNKIREITARPTGTSHLAPEEFTLLREARAWVHSSETRTPTNVVTRRVWDAAQRLRQTYTA